MVIALCGLPRVGKDEFANSIVSSHTNVLKYSFAEPIKLMLCAAFGWRLEDFENDNKDLIDPYWGISKRQAMEYIGSTVMRGSIREQFPLFDKLIGERIWVKRFEKFYLENKHKDIIVTDLRYNPEYEFFSTIKRKVVLINRPNCDASKWYDIQNFKYDCVLENDRSLLEYRLKCNELYILMKERMNANNSVQYS